MTLKDLNIGQLTDLRDRLKKEYHYDQGYSETEKVAIKKLYEEVKNELIEKLYQNFLQEFLKYYIKEDKNNV